MTTLKQATQFHRFIAYFLTTVTGLILGDVAMADSPNDKNIVKEADRVSLNFREWRVEWKNTRPRDPYVSPDGSVWFVGQVGDYVARLDPQTGEMQRFDIPKAGPHTVIVDAEGYPWYAGNKDRHIGRLDPDTGDVTRFDMPKGVNDPHTMDWTSDGNIWFTVQRSGQAGFIGKLATDSGELEIIEVPGNNMRPYGLVVDKQNRPWIAFMGSNAIGTVDPKSMQLDIINTPDEESIIRRIGLTSDGRVWWVDAGVGYVGVYNPQDESMQQWRTPGGEAAGLYAMTVDNQDRIWYVETGLQPNRFIGFDSKTEQFIAIDEVPSGGQTVRHMVFDETSNAIWFGTDAHTIGRAVVPD
ncbi:MULTISPECIES: virginiamycin B lyase family protein [unclassified Methylophaga]|uniref:Vgb family protein n=1 Tax=unclassified Methylophaga TaxID=2629249 RepID=UPI0025F64E2F|nr:MULTISPECIES: lyase [unclassified Methylophaga]